MGSFIIEGGHRLQGEVIPQGAKNEALQILCAVMLTAEPVTIHNLPDIIDVNNCYRLTLPRIFVNLVSCIKIDTFSVKYPSLNYLVGI